MIYHTVKHNLSYNSMDCGNKLLREIFGDSKVASKIACGRTKAEMIVKKVLAPKSVTDFVNNLNDPSKSGVFFSIATDASNHKNRKMFPVVVRYFDPLVGIQNKILDFIEQADESATGIYNLLKCSIQNNGLSLENVSSFCADNANVNYGKHHSVMKLLNNDNGNILSANCSNHILHNGCKHASDILDIDIELIVLKLYGHFASSAKRREKLQSFFTFVDLEWSEILRHVPTRWLSLTPAVDRVLSNWEAIRSYLKSVEDCPKALQKYFSDDDSGKDLILQAYFCFFSHIGNILVNTSKYIENADLTIMETFTAVRGLLDKICQRKSDKFFGSGTHKILAMLGTNNRNLAEVIFIEFYSHLHAYLTKRFIIVQNIPINDLLPLCLNKEIQFNELQDICKYFQFELNEDDLYDEFCSVREILKCKIDLTGNANACQKWVAVFCECRSKGINIPNLEKVLSFVMSIPGSNAHTERVFSIMNNKWTDVRNRSATELIKAEMQIVTNFSMTCKEFFKLSSTDLKLLTECKSNCKYL